MIICPGDGVPGIGIQPLEPDVVGLGIGSRIHQDKAQKGLLPVAGDDLPGRAIGQTIVVTIANQILQGMEPLDLLPDGCFFRRSQRCRV